MPNPCFVIHKGERYTPEQFMAKLMDKEFEKYVYPKEVKPLVSDSGKIKVDADEIRGITLKANEERREDIGMPKREAIPETFLKWDEEAKKEIENGYDINGLISKMERGDAVTPIENSIRKIYAATLDKQIKDNPTDALLKQAKRYAEAEAIANAQAGKNLVSLKGASNQLSTITDFYVAKMQALEVDSLTEAQKKSVKEKFDKVQTELNEYKKIYTELEAKNSELQAEIELLKTQKKSTPQKIYTNGKRDYTAERTLLKEKLKKQVDEYKQSAQKMGIASDGGAEGFIITTKMAKTIMDIVKSHVDEVGAKLSEVTKRTFEDVKDIFQGITEKDIHDVISGLYNEKKPQKSQLLADLDLIKREQKLLNEIDRINNKIPKEEKAEREKNKKLSELSKQIKQLKKEEGIEEYSDEAKIKRLIKANEEKERQIRDKIKNKDFDTAPPKKGIYGNEELKKKYPELYNKLLDSYIKKEDAQHEFDIEVYKDELSKRTKLEKATDFVSKAVGTSKAIVTGIDDSAAGIQTYLSLITRPIIGIRALKLHAIHAISEAKFNRFLAELHNSSDYQLMVDSGLHVSEPKSLLAEKKEEIFNNRFSGTIKMKLNGKEKEFKIIDAPLKPFERAFTSLGNAVRVIAFRTKAAEYISKGYTFEKDPELFKSLARRLNEESGRGKENEKLRQASKITTLGIWSPKLMATKFNILGVSDLASLFLSDKGTKGYYRQLHPKERVQAIKDVAGFAASVFAISYLTAWANNGDLDDDPLSPTFLDIKLKNGKSYNLSGGFSSYISKIAQVVRGGKRIDGQFKPYANYKTGMSEVGHFMRGKMPPVSAALVNTWEGKDFMGNKTTALEQSKGLLSPISIKGITQQIQRDGYSSIFTEGLPTFVGINVKDERDFEKVYSKDDYSVPSVKYIIDKGVELPNIGSINQYKIKVDEKHPEIGKEADGDKYSIMSEAEYTEFKKVKKQLVTEYLDKIYKAKQEGNELSKEEISKALERISQITTKLAKEKVIGEQKETKEDKKIKRETSKKINKILNL